MTSGKVPGAVHTLCKANSGGRRFPLSLDKGIVVRVQRGSRGSNIVKYCVITFMDGPPNELMFLIFIVYLIEWIY